MEGNTEAVQYALRKNIAVKKAALLRERREAAQKSFLDEDGEDEVAVPQRAPAAAMQGATRYASVKKLQAPVQESPRERTVPDHVIVMNDRQLSGSREAEGGAARFTSVRPALQRNFDDLPVGRGSNNSANYEWEDGSAGAAARAYGAPPKVGSSRGKNGAAAAGREEAFGGPRWGEGAEDFLSPRSPSRQQLQEGSQAGRPSPGSSERVASNSKRLVGAAAAPFGNDYSWETSA
jgi:hypothetical protein